jgi:hypothetical protein
MTPEEDAVVAVIDALNELSLPYMVVGSFSSNYYGVSRSTKDFDVVIQLSGQSIRGLADKLKEGFHFDPQMKFETVTGTTKYLFQLRESPFEVEVFLLSKDEHDQERFARRKPARLSQRNAYVPTVEDVIVMKARWAATRRKDWDDISNVIAVSGDTIDWSYVNAWADRHGTRQILDEIKESIPKE